MAESPTDAWDLPFEPPRESRVNTPLPIFVRVPAELDAASVKLHYKPYGAVKWSSIQMRRMQDGFATEIPCSDLSTAGVVRLYLVVLDAQGDLVASNGSRKNPRRTEIRSRFDGDPPALPGKRPPVRCVWNGEMPPN